MNQFVHVGLVFPGVPKMRDLEPIFTQISDDWIRYSANNWILWTSKNATEVGNALISRIDEQDHFLIVPVDMNFCAGRLAPWIWTWINSKGVKTITVPGAFLPKP